MLLTVLEIRNRMLNCKGDAQVSLSFGNDDVVLRWEWTTEEDCEVSHEVVVPINSVRTNSRSFEREMHKAKRFLKYGNKKGVGIC